jgi:hypothetical protein
MTEIRRTYVILFEPTREVSRRFLHGLKLKIRRKSVGDLPTNHRDNFWSTDIENSTANFLGKRHTTYSNLELPVAIQQQSSHRTVKDFVGGLLVEFPLPWGMQSHMKALLEIETPPVQHLQDYPLLGQRLRTLYDCVSVLPKLVISKSLIALTDTHSQRQQASMVELLYANIVRCIRDHLRTNLSSIHYNSTN